MPTFGEFETVGQPLVSSDQRGDVSTIWRARKSGSREERLYAVKCFAPRPAESREGAPADILEQDLRIKFIKEVVEPHKRALSRGGACLAPIYQFGTTETEAWYVTDFYGLSNTLSNSLKQYINGKGEANTAVLRHVLESVVTACLTLKQWRGYSHGNLKPSNVFRAGRTEWRKAQVFLTDPYPAPPVQFDRFDAGDRSDVSETLRATVEAQDLAAVGALILQLVERRLFVRNDDYNYPVGRSRDWDALGKDADYWLGWCNKLLDPQLSLEAVNLGLLEKEFGPRRGGFAVLAGKFPAIATKVATSFRPSPGALKAGIQRFRASTEGKNLPRIAGALGAVCVLGLVAYLAVFFVRSWNKDVEQKYQQAIADSKEAERTNAWALACASWHQAERLRSGSSEVRTGITFTESITNLQARIQKISTNDLQSARAALVECKNLLEGLPRRDLWEGNQPRSMVVEALSNQVALVQAGAVTASKSMGQAEALASARKGAQDAETKGDWSSAGGRWRSVQSLGPADPDVQAGIRFAEGMTNLQARFNRLSTNDMDSAQAATNECAALLRALPTRDLWIDVPVRSNAVVALSNSLAGVSKVALAKINSMALDEKFQSARSAARRAESTNGWALASGQWRAADVLRGGEPEVQKGIAFSDAMTNLLWKLAQVRTNDLDSAQAATNQCAALLGALPLRDLWIEVPVRSNAVLVLSNRAAQVQMAAGALIMTWETERLKVALERARGLFEQGQYDEVLQICSNYREVGSFKDLARIAQEERGALADGTRRFGEGDYSFIAELQSRSCTNKVAFSNLLQKANVECSLLKELSTLTNSPSMWPELDKQIAGLGSAGLPPKPPFRAISQWWSDANPKTELELELRVLQGLFKRLPDGYQFPQGQPQNFLEKNRGKLLPRDYVISKSSKVNEFKRGISVEFYQSYLKAFRERYTRQLGPLSPDVKRQFDTLDRTITMFND